MGLEFGKRHECLSKRPPIVWSEEIQRHFLRVVDELGVEATPTLVLSHMNVEGLRDRKSVV